MYYHFYYDYTIFTYITNNQTRAALFSFAINLRIIFTINHFFLQNVKTWGKYPHHIVQGYVLKKLVLSDQLSKSLK